MFCTKCGKELHNDKGFCAYCGAKAKGNGGSEAAPQSEDKGGNVNDLEKEIMLGMFGLSEEDIKG